MKDSAYKPEVNAPLCNVTQNGGQNLMKCQKALVSPATVEQPVGDDKKCLDTMAEPWLSGSHEVDGKAARRETKEREFDRWVNIFVDLEIIKFYLRQIKASNERLLAADPNLDAGSSNSQG